MHRLLTRMNGNNPPRRLKRRDEQRILRALLAPRVEGNVPIERYMAIQIAMYWCGSTCLVLRTPHLESVLDALRGPFAELDRVGYELARSADADAVSVSVCGMQLAAAILLKCTEFSREAKSLLLLPAVEGDCENYVMLRRLLFLENYSRRAGYGYCESDASTDVD